MSHDEHWLDVSGGLGHVSLFSPSSLRVRLRTRHFWLIHIRIFKTCQLGNVWSIPLSLFIE